MRLIIVIILLVSIQGCSIANRKVVDILSIPKQPHEIALAIAEVIINNPSHIHFTERCKYFLDRPNPKWNTEQLHYMWNRFMNEHLNNNRCFDSEGKETTVDIYRFGPPKIESIQTIKETH